MRYCKIHTQIYDLTCAKCDNLAIIVPPCHCCSPTHHPQSQWEAVCNTDLWKTHINSSVTQAGNVLHPVTQLLHWDCKPVAVYSLELCKWGAHEADLMMQVKTFIKAECQHFVHSCTARHKHFL